MSFKFLHSFPHLFIPLSFAGRVFPCGHHGWTRSSSLVRLPLPIVNRFPFPGKVPTEQAGEIGGGQTMRANQRPSQAKANAPKKRTQESPPPATSFDTLMHPQHPPGCSSSSSSLVAYSPNPIWLSAHAGSQSVEMGGRTRTRTRHRHIHTHCLLSTDALRSEQAI